MAVPKKRKSKQKTRQVKAGRPKQQIVQATACPNCGSPKMSHRMCENCGYHNGKVYPFAKSSGESSSEESEAA
ncbi:MAG: 50S ribosomal protein L32 [Candidatus Caenarcaniphilales bacterium]|nr:50S ribosomal protein L32 [Candidatus Caenarcaniphilales bacterium]